MDIGFLVFPRVQQLDLTGPYEVLASLPQARALLVAKSLDPVASATGLRLTPDVTFADCPELDVICVPGGDGVNPLLGDAETLAFLRRQAAGARYVTSVCTGALLLGAAGLLKGKRATTHWASHHFLSAFGAIPVDARFVRDGNLMTGGGVTAGIDFALALVAEIAGPAAAQAIQLHLEYAPAPPFAAGRPDTAPSAVLEKVRTRIAPGLAERARLVAEAAERLIRRRRGLDQRLLIARGAVDEQALERGATVGTERHVDREMIAVAQLLKIAAGAFRHEELLDVVVDAIGLAGTNAVPAAGAHRAHSPFDPGAACRPDMGDGRGLPCIARTRERHIDRLALGKGVVAFKRSTVQTRDGVGEHDVITAQQVARIDRHDGKAHLLPALQEQGTVGDQPADQPRLQQEGDGKRQAKGDPPLHGTASPERAGTLAARRAR